jgi:hypothetical protein
MLFGRVELPITNHYPITEHFFRSCHFCFILSDLKCYGSATSGSRNHLMGLICHILKTKILQNFQSVFGSLMGMICHIPSIKFIKVFCKFLPSPAPSPVPCPDFIPSFWISLKVGKMVVKIENWGSEVKIGDEIRFSFFFLFSFLTLFRVWPHLGTYFWNFFDFCPGSQKL